MQIRARPPLLTAIAAGVVLAATACASAGVAAPTPTPPPAACTSSTPQPGSTVSGAFVCVDAPAPGATVGRSLTLGGRAANGGPFRVEADLIDGSGLIAVSGSDEFPGATAPPVVRAWQVKLAVPTTVEAGRATLVVRAFDTEHRTLGEADVPVTVR